MQEASSRKQLVTTCFMRTRIEVSYFVLSKLHSSFWEVKKNDALITHNNRRLLVLITITMQRVIFIHCHNTKIARENIFCHCNNAATSHLLQKG